MSSTELRNTLNGMKLSSVKVLAKHLGLYNTNIPKKELTETLLTVYTVGLLKRTSHLTQMLAEFRNNRFAAGGSVDEIVAAIRSFDPNAIVFAVSPCSESVWLRKVWMAIDMLKLQSKYVTSGQTQYLKLSNLQQEDVFNCQPVEGMDTIIVNNREYSAPNRMNCIVNDSFEELGSDYYAVHKRQVFPAIAEPVQTFEEFVQSCRESTEKPFGSFAMESNAHPWAKQVDQRPNGTEKPTGFERQANENPTGIGRQAKENPTGIGRQAKENPTGIGRQAKENPTGFERKANENPTGIGRQANENPTGSFAMESNAHPSAKQVDQSDFNNEFPVGDFNNEFPVGADNIAEPTDDDERSAGISSRVKNRRKKRKQTGARMLSSDTDDESSDDGSSDRSRPKRVKKVMNEKPATVDTQSSTNSKKLGDYGETDDEFSELNHFYSTDGDEKNYSED